MGKVVVLLVRVSMLTSFVSSDKEIIVSIYIDEEGEQKNVQSKNIEAIRGKFDRSTLLESFLMDEDDSIRSTDRAERLQSWLTRRCKVRLPLCTIILAVNRSFNAMS